MSFDTAPPLSKTAKYKKITKPLLERKRRARINRCLDELKDLMVSALEIDDDNLSKLEKADILELTVNHLTKLHSPKDPVTEAQKFQAGFGQCAAEACRFIMAVPDLDANVSQNLISHLSRLITVQPLSIQVPERASFTPPQTSPSSVISDRQHYFSDYDRSSSDAEDSTYSGDGATKQWTHKQSKRSSVKQSPPLTGLLTTVDKLAAPCYPSPEQTHTTRNSTYFNRVPAEAKDVILQKIRQHIMDKRGNYVNGDVIGNQTAIEHRQSQGDTNCHYSPNVPSNYDTLDLRKVRTPAKYASEQIHSPEKAVGVAYREANQLDTTPLADSKVEVPSLPEQCELPMDYSYLPKKKRKLIEYQEHKKQEEAKRRLDAFCEKKNDNHEEGPPGNHEVDCNKWRPW